MPMTHVHNETKGTTASAISNITPMTHVHNETKDTTASAISNITLCL